MGGGHGDDEFRDGVGGDEVTDVVQGAEDGEVAEHVTLLGGVVVDEADGDHAELVGGNEFLDD